jgi:hypothetical protein
VLRGQPQAGNAAEPALQLLARAPGNERDPLVTLRRQAREQVEQLPRRSRVARTVGEGDEGAVVVQQQQPFRGVAVRGDQIRDGQRSRQLAASRAARERRLPQRGDEPLAPRHRVVSHHPRMQGGHALAPLVSGQAEDPLQGRGRALLVVGIDEESLPHLCGRARELAEQQHSFASALAGDVLLRDEVHAVEERRDPCHVRRRIEGHELGPRDRTADVDDGRPVRSAELAVDLAHELVHLAVQPRIQGDPLPRGDGHLYQDHPSAQTGRALQQAAERAQPFRNPLRVVEPVHREEQLAAREAPAQALERPAHGGAVVERPGEVLGHDADGQGLQTGEAPVDLDAVHAAAHAEDAQQ